MIFSCNLKHANEGHLKYMTEKGANNEAVENFGHHFFARYLLNGNFMDSALSNGPWVWGFFLIEAEVAG